MDGDLNRDGFYQEDDPQESMGAGLIVPLNTDDDDNDGVIDYIDGYNADGIANEDDIMAVYDANNNPTPVVDDDLVEVKLTALPVDLGTGIVTLEIIQGADKIKVWTDPAKGAANLLIDGPAAITAKSWVLGTDIADLSQLPKSIYIEGINPGLNEDDSVILVTNYKPVGATSATEFDRLLITVFQTALVPDYNRDGVIDDKDWGRVTEAEPWRFWVNDDHDAAADSDGIGGSKVDLPGQDTNDTANTKVTNIRDLVDFFPLYLDLKAALTMWPRAKGYQYKLFNADGSVAMFIPAANGNYLSTDDVAAYLEDVKRAKELLDLPLTVINDKGVELSSAFLSLVDQYEEYGVILLEGIKESTTPLIIEITDSNGQIAHQTELPLEIVKVEQMYGHKDLREEADQNAVVANDRFVEFNDDTVPDHYLNSKQPYCMQGEDKSLVWMHGYRVNPEDARATYAEVFKRFFHAGLNGRFYGVSWYGNPQDGTLLNLAPHYHQSVVNAFATAGAYRDFISSIPGITSIAAHSLGNLVVGSAIEDHNLVNFNKYFAVDAAVALEAYGQVSDVSTLVNTDGTLTADPNAGMVNVGDWPGFIAADQWWLLASEWHRLFENADPVDNRKYLTWRKRLGKVVSQTGAQVYNFYSSTEDVLRAYPEDDLIKWWELVKNPLAFFANLATSTWVKQEKFKGRNSILKITDNVGGVSSNYGGWSFNLDDWFKTDPDWTDVSGEMLPQHLEPADVAVRAELQPVTSLAYPEILRTKPFFDVPAANLPNLLKEVNGITPSEYVMKNISETKTTSSDISSYYTHNKAAQSKVKVRDWLLAEAFPATTLPMGANESTKLLSNNIDISGDSSKGKCCKTSEDLWPRLDTYIENVGDWKHSDYKDVPYQHTFGFYNKIKELMQ